MARAARTMAWAVSSLSAAVSGVDNAPSFLLAGGRYAKVEGMATAAVRRRQLSVLAAAALAFAAGATLGAPGDDAPPPPRRAAAAPSPPAMPPERQVGELVVLRFDGTTV